MRILGMEIGRAKSLAQVSSRGWMPIIREAAPGNWQRNVEVKADAVIAHHAAFACMTLIAGDISKLRVKLVQRDADGVWTETANPAFSPVLRKPNPYQTRIQFFENWVLSKLVHGNTYVLKTRDGRNVVDRMDILDASRVKPLVADDGSVFYEIQPDNLSASRTPITVPAREIIHDRFNCLFHPLVGLPPIFANGLAATQGLAIQNNSARFFGNGAQPGGLLTAPGEIKDENAKQLKDYWDKNFTGENAGKIAVLGDGLTYTPLVMKSTEAQLLEQLKWSAETVCSTYHVPAYKVGIGAMPTHNNIQALNVEYFTQALQKLVEDMEACLDEGLGTGENLGTEFDIEGLLRMDSLTLIQMLKEADGIMSPNEKRKRLDLKPREGGDSIYLQQQNFSLEALARRDAKEDPFNSPPAPAAEPSPPINPEVERGAFFSETLLSMKKALEAQ